LLASSSAKPVTEIDLLVTSTPPLIFGVRPNTSPSSSLLTSSADFSSPEVSVPVVASTLAGLGPGAAAGSAGGVSAFAFQLSDPTTVMLPPPSR
jgi:hypothetical protein